MNERVVSAFRKTSCGIGLAVSAMLGCSMAYASADYPAVTFDRLANAQNDTGWLAYYRTHNGQSHSPLSQINPSNVANLKQAGAYKFPDELNGSIVVGSAAHCPAHRERPDAAPDEFNFLTSTTSWFAGLAEPS